MSAYAYRKPSFYLAPFNYCDRWCERCRIEKRFCLLWQDQADRDLEAMSRGQDTRSLGYALEQTKNSLLDALFLLEEEARDQGLDMEDLHAQADENGTGKTLFDQNHPRVEEAMALSGAVAALLDDQEAVLATLHDRGELDLDRLRWYHTTPGPRMARFLNDPVPSAAGDDGDDELDALDILSAQSAHQAICEIETSLLAIRRALPSLTDGLIDTLARCQSLKRFLEEGWLEKPHPLLEPIGEGPWWGPLEQPADTLEKLRDVRKRRADQAGGDGR